MSEHRPTDPPEHVAMPRRRFIGAGLLGGAAWALGGGARAAAAAPVPGRRTAAGEAAVPPFELEETTVQQLQDGMRSGRWTARSITEQYLARIDEIDRRGPTLNAVIEVNPDALFIADALDAERRAGRVRGPLHGIPVLIKDNVGTADRMETTAGSLALVGARPARDAFVAARLREAGAVILGKTNLSEWANFRSTHSTSGWSGRGGQTHNPYALDRTPSGSSSGSGSAAAASLAAIALGTETDGSVTSPASCAGLVGIKPTVGLVSRAGIVPISHVQDTAGPMARCVADAAALLAALTGVDRRDPATAASRGHDVDLGRALDPDGLRGARIGVPRAHFTGYSRATDARFQDALGVLRSAGATIVDPADIPTAGKWEDAEFQSLVWEFRADLNAYLAELPAGSSMRSIADIIAFNQRHAAREMPYFGQEIMEMAQKRGALTDPKYTKARGSARRLAATQGIDAVMTRHRLDALVAPTQGPAAPIDLVNGDGGAGGSFTSPAAVAGYPHVTVPMGAVFGLPVGLSFVGRPWTESTLIRFAFAFEQATHHRRAPRFLPTADVSTGAGA